MNRNLEQLQNYVNHLLYDQLAITLMPEELDEEYQEFAKTLLILGKSVLELYNYTYEISDGILEREMSNNNPLIGPLKDMQSKLIHITWQTMQVEKGNFDIEIQYLGEFSTAFQSMVEQLKIRSELAQKNAALERQMLEADKRLLEHELENQCKHYQSITDINKELQACRHDIKNHLLCLGVLLEQDKKEQAKKYLKVITQQIFHKKEVISTDNYILDALLSEKSQIAQEKDIEIRMELHLKKELKIDPATWCIIFGNALDNAIEACEKVHTGKPFITVHVECTGNMLKIKIENSMTGTLIPKDHLFETTKAGQEHHGFGLDNMENAVLSHDGIMEVSANHGIFTLQILLCDVI